MRLLGIRMDLIIVTSAGGKMIRVGTELVLKENYEGESVYLTFPHLSNTGIIEHFISTRLGGVSKGYFSTLNLSYSRGDEKPLVDENFARVAQLLNRKVADFVFSDQTHTTNVMRVEEADRGKGIVKDRDYKDVDGLVTNVAGIVLATFYADCVPLIFVDPIKKAIGCSHSGWKGTVGKIGRQTVEKMQIEFGSDPKDILVGIGPSICKDCYEISEDVAIEFRKNFTQDAIKEILYAKEDGKYLLDLWRANQLVLEEAGIKTEQIAVTDVCTCCNKELLFSHRATGGKRGNFGVFVSIK